MKKGKERSNANLIELQPCRRCNRLHHVNCISCIASSVPPETPIYSTSYVTNLVTQRC